MSLILIENEQVNRLAESLHLFEDVTNSDIFKKASIILFLNKTGINRKLIIITDSINALSLFFEF